jgi:hypothetical protein
MVNFSVDLLNEEYLLRNIPNVVILSLFIVVGTLGNIAVLIVYVRDMENVFASRRLFIPFMAFADLVTLIFNGVVELKMEIQLFEESDNATECKMLRFYGLALVIASGCLYFAIAVHRYILICRPNNEGITQKWKIIILIAIVIFIFGISAPKYVFSGSTVVTMESIKLPNQTVVTYVCGSEETFENKTSSNIYFYVLTINSFIWTSALAVLYTLVGKEIGRQNKEAFSNQERGGEGIYRLTTDSTRLDRTDPQQQNSRFTESFSTFITNNRLTWMFILMTVLNVISYIPKLVIDIMYNKDRYFFFRKTNDVYAVLMFFDHFYLCNQVVNPFIYGFFDTEFRHRFKKRFCSCIR